MATARKTAAGKAVAAKAAEVKETAKETAKVVEEEVKETAKAVTEKAEEVKETVKKKAPRKTAANKTVKAVEEGVKETAKAVTEKAEEVKKEVKKTVKKAVKKEAKNEIILQWNGNDYSAERLIQSAKDVWQYDLGKDVSKFESVQIYVKPEEGKAYAVVNGTESLSFNI